MPFSTAPEKSEATSLAILTYAEINYAKDRKVIRSAHETRGMARHETLVMPPAPLADRYRKRLVHLLPVTRSVAERIEVGPN